jgi:hypothetical protein
MSYADLIAEANALPNPRRNLLTHNERELIGLCYRLRDALQTLLREREAYKRACKTAGVCMSCVIQPPEPYGCTDCLNTGWERGDPYEHVKSLEAEREADKARIAELEAEPTRLCDLLKGAREAMKPFNGMLASAKFAGYGDLDAINSMDLSATWGDLRAIAAIASEIEKELSND